MALRSSEVDVDNFLSKVRVLITRDFAFGLESESTLTEQDVESLRKLKELQIRARPREFSTNERRMKLIDCILEHGATSGVYRAIHNLDYPGRLTQPLLADLWNYLPRHIVKNWIEKAQTKGNEVTENLVCFAYESGDYRMLLRMLDYGVNYQSKNDQGTELCNLGNKCGISLTLGIVRNFFIQAEAGLELDLQNQSLDRFLAIVHARNNEKLTILQLALKSGHIQTAAQIVHSIIHEIPENYELDVSDAMTYDELLDACKLILNEIKFKLGELVENDDIFEQALTIFKAAAKLLTIWQKYEEGMDNFFGEPHLSIVDEMLELLGFGLSLTADRVSRFREIWLKHEIKSRNTKSFVVDIAQMTIVAPIEAFIKATYGAKLHQATEVGDFATAVECIRENAKLELRDRYTNIKLLHRVIDRGDEAIAVLLLENKTDPRLKYYHPQSLMHLAVERDSFAIVEAMLKNFDDVGARNDYLEKTNHGLTALQLAGKLGKLEICKLLLKYQANFRRGKHEDLDFDNSAATLTKDVKVKALFALIDWFFARASIGSPECLRKLKELAPDQLLAICNARDENGHDLEQIALINKHSGIANEICNLRTNYN